MICPVHTPPADAGIIRWTPTVEQLVSVVVVWWQTFWFFSFLFGFYSVSFFRR
jgi:hypothetical protein